MGIVPGIFGGVGCPPACLEALSRDHSAIWGETHPLSPGGGALGGHAHGGARAAYRLPDGTCFAVDGEAAIYVAARDVAERWKEQKNALFSLDSEGCSTSARCKGNIVLVDPISGAWFVAVEPAGAFPLFYTRAAGGLLFSSLLRPLAGALALIGGVRPDMTAIVEVMRKDYMLAGRTHFEGILRLLPGQILRYDPELDRMRVSETSDMWVGVDRSPESTPDREAELCWETLDDALGRCLVDDQRAALMMSAGWDSRTLLAAMAGRFEPGSLLCYSHGDLESREMAITSRIAEVSGMPLRREPLTADEFAPENLAQGFPRIENAAFPEWQRAGEILADLGVTCVTSGVYGEVIGGHYGSVTLHRGMRKITALGSELIRRRHPQQDLTPLNLPVVRDLVRIGQPEKPWFMAQDTWEGIPTLQEEMDADLEGDLSRLIDRGILTSEQLIEAYLTEHRAAQNISAQPLSCRANVDVTLPFADRELLRMGGRLPMGLKIQNSLNLQMLGNHAPRLAAPPTAATLVPASAPIVVQEASRLVRRIYESNRWRLHFASRGGLSQPRTGWWQLEFLRGGAVFAAILDDLRMDIWDRGEIRKRIADNAANRATLDWRSPTALLAQHMLRISTVDRMLRQGG